MERQKGLEKKVLKSDRRITERERKSEREAE